MSGPYCASKGMTREGYGRAIVCKQGDAMYPVTVFDLYAFWKNN